VKVQAAIDVITSAINQEHLASPRQQHPGRRHQTTDGDS
jgi:hypothetical protein